MWGSCNTCKKRSLHSQWCYALHRDVSDFDGCKLHELKDGLTPDTCQSPDIDNQVFWDYMVDRYDY